MAAATTVSRTGGFTLMETLVSLVIVTLAAGLMLQITGHFTRVYDRLLGSGQELAARRRSELWFRDSLAAATPSVREAEEGYLGTSSELQVTTLAPLARIAGLPTRIAWRVDSDGETDRLVYAEAGGGEWVVLDGLRAGSASLAFVDSEGRRHQRWPVRTEARESPPVLWLVHFHAETTEPVDWYAAPVNQTLGWLAEEE
jgi:type II secretory pathway pseudopilin PulG